MLTPSQLQAIDLHLRKENWLLNEELIAELTDHYVAGIDERMTKGMTFEAAVREIHTGFGGRKGLLKMEEDFQGQKFRQLNLMEWQLIHSFIYGSRWSVSVGIFLGLFVLNTYLGQQEAVESATYMGFWFVTSSVLGNLLRGILIFYQNRREINSASLNANSVLFIGAYLCSLALLLANKYLFPSYSFGFSRHSVLILTIFLETLCIVYYIAIALAIRNFLINSRKRPINKVA